jgi:TRAP-type mannitol/chloroaromatic compound transport system permease large subunit
VRLLSGSEQFDDLWVLAEELLDTVGRAFGRLKGGMRVSVVLVNALPAASTAIVGTTVLALGLIALLIMLRSDHDQPVASGSVCVRGAAGVGSLHLPKLYLCHFFLQPIDQRRDPQ